MLAGGVPFDRVIADLGFTMDQVRGEIHKAFYGYRVAKMHRTEAS
jgi:hypothetical protein